MSCKKKIRPYQKQATIGVLSQKRFLNIPSTSELASGFLQLISRKQEKLTDTDTGTLEESKKWKSEKDLKQEIALKKEAGSKQITIATEKKTTEVKKSFLPKSSVGSSESLESTTSLEQPTKSTTSENPVVLPDSLFELEENLNDYKKKVNLMRLDISTEKEEIKKVDPEKDEEQKELMEETVKKGKERHLEYLREKEKKEQEELKKEKEEKKRQKKPRFRM